MRFGCKARTRWGNRRILRALRFLPQRCRAPSTQARRDSSGDRHPGGRWRGFPPELRLREKKRAPWLIRFLGHSPHHSLRLLPARKRLLLGAQPKDDGFGVAFQNPPQNASWHKLWIKIARDNAGGRGGARLAQGKAGIRLALQSRGQRGRDATLVRETALGVRGSADALPAEEGEMKDVRRRQITAQPSTPHTLRWRPGFSSRFSVPSPASTAGSALKAGPRVPGTGWDQKGEQRAGCRSAGRAHLERAGSASKLLPGSEMRAMRSHREFAPRHPSLPSAATNQVPEIETEKEKKVISKK